MISLCTMDFGGVNFEQFCLHHSMFVSKSDRNALQPLWLSITSYVMTDTVMASSLEFRHTIFLNLGGKSSILPQL